MISQLRRKRPPAYQGRHCPPGPGPVTAANKVMSAVAVPRRRASAVALRAWPAVPALALLWPAYHGLLTAYADPVLGYDALLCMVACLAVTPVITVARTPVSRLRWWYGNWVFVLGAAGLAVHLAYPPGSLASRAAGTSVVWTGTLIIVLLLPMAATSTVAAQKLLGPEWKRWQRVLVWVTWAVIGLHLGVMHSWPALGAYGGATLPAVLVRRPRVRKSIKSWRAGGYSTGGWWAALAAFTAVALAGVAVLVTREVAAVARALTAA